MAIANGLIRLGRLSMRATRRVPLGANSKSLVPSNAVKVARDQIRRLSDEELDFLKKYAEKGKAAAEKQYPQFKDKAEDLLQRQKEQQKIERAHRLRGENADPNSGETEIGISDLTDEEKRELAWRGTGALDAGMIGLPIAAGLGAGVAKDYGEAFGLRKSPQQREMEKQMLLMQAGQSSKSLGDMRRAQENVQRLARIDPQAAQELMVGAQLPNGATVVGGQPRQDLMQMAGQHLMPPQDPDPLVGTFF